MWLLKARKGKGSLKSLGMRVTIHIHGKGQKQFHDYTEATQSQQAHTGFIQLEGDSKV